LNTITEFFIGGINYTFWRYGTKIWDMKLTTSTVEAEWITTEVGEVNDERIMGSLDREKAEEPRPRYG